MALPIEHEQQPTERRDITVVAMSAGRFTSASQSAVATAEGELLAPGELLGRVGVAPVQSPCAAWMMDVLAPVGEHVEEGAALFRIRPL